MAGPNGPRRPGAPGKRPGNLPGKRPMGQRPGPGGAQRPGGPRPGAAPGQRPPQRRPMPASARPQGHPGAESEGFEDGEEMYEGPQQAPFLIRNAWPLAIIVSALCVGGAIYIMISGSAGESKNQVINAFNAFVISGEAQTQKVKDAELLKGVSQEDIQIMQEAAANEGPPFITKVYKPKPLADYTSPYVSKEKVLTGHSAMMKLNDRYQEFDTISRDFTGSGAEAAKSQLGDRFQGEILPRYVRLLNELVYLSGATEVIYDERVPKLGPTNQAMLMKWRDSLKKLKSPKQSRVFAQGFQEYQEAIKEDASRENELAQIALSEMLGAESVDDWRQILEGDAEYYAGRAEKADNDEDRTRYQRQVDAIKISLRLAPEAWDALGEEVGDEFARVNGQYADFVLSQANSEWKQDAQRYAAYVVKFNAELKIKETQQSRRLEIAQKLANKHEIAGNDTVIKIIARVQTNVENIKASYLELPEGAETLAAESMAGDLVTLLESGTTNNQDLLDKLELDDLNAIKLAINLDSPLPQLAGMAEPPELDTLLEPLTTPDALLDSHGAAMGMGLSDLIETASTQERDVAEAGVKSVAVRLAQITYFNYLGDEALSSEASPYVNQRVMAAFKEWQLKLSSGASSTFISALRRAMDDRDHADASILQQLKAVEALVSAGSMEALKEEQQDKPDNLAEVLEGSMDKLEELRAYINNQHDAFVEKVLMQAQSELDAAQTAYATRRDEVMEQINEYLDAYTAAKTVADRLIKELNLGDNASVKAALAEYDIQIQDTEAAIARVTEE